MSESKEWIELKETLRLFTIWTLSSLIDSAFLALWVTVQWVVNKTVITPLTLTGIDKLVLTTFQVFFAISTLAPIAITIYRDIRIMWLRTSRRIRSEIQIREHHERD
jgi:hypothetical protein